MAPSSHPSPCVTTARYQASRKRVSRSAHTSRLPYEPSSKVPKRQHTSNERCMLRADRWSAAWSCSCGALREASVERAHTTHPTWFHGTYLRAPEQHHYHLRGMPPTQSTFFFVIEMKPESVLAEASANPTADPSALTNDAQTWRGLSEYPRSSRVPPQARKAAPGTQSTVARPPVRHDLSQRVT